MIDKRLLRLKRKLRIRSKITGTQKRPRMAVYRSNKAFMIQLIDDGKQETLLSLSMRGKTIEKAKALGIEVAKKAVKKGITNVVFDRGGYRYHGSIKAVADGAREGGLKI